MKSLIKTLFLFCLPLLMLLGIYVWTDPFKVIHKYDIYLSDYVMLNRAFISTEMFLKNNPEHKFDSFIFGSSRSCAYTSREWSNFLPSGCSPFSYSAWHETFEGIYHKILFIDSRRNRIKNALIIIDVDYTFKKGMNTLDKDHYLISGRSFGQFQLMCFSQFLRDYWLIPECVDFKIFGKQRPYMKNFFSMKPSDLDPENNDWFPDSELSILKDSIAYYQNSLKKFYKRTNNEIVSPPQITVADSVMLLEINNIFKKNKTEVKFIISPLYDQIKMSPKDIRMLQSIFGVNNIYDFSGINQLTNDIYSYSNDVTHYRKRTANKILRSIYGEKRFCDKQLVRNNMKQLHSNEQIISK